MTCLSRAASSLESDTHYRSDDHLALRLVPPPLQLLQQVNELVNSSGIKGEVDKSVRALAQSALAKLDVVSREEFDAQAEILKRTRAKVVALETELEELTRELDALTGER